MTKKEGAGDGFLVFFCSADVAAYRERRGV